MECVAVSTNTTTAVPVYLTLVTDAREAGVVVESTQLVTEVIDGEIVTSTVPSVVVSSVGDVTVTTVSVSRNIVTTLSAAQGPVGPPGSGDGQTSNYVYGETISALKAVVIIDGEAFLADSTNAAHRGLVCGVAVTAATTGNLGTIRFLGAMSDAVWNWTGPQLFVGTNGTLVESPPTSGFSQVVARVEASNTIFINPFQPIERA